MNGHALLLVFALFLAPLAGAQTVVPWPWAGEIPAEGDAPPSDPYENPHHP